MPYTRIVYMNGIEEFEFLTGSARYFREHDGSYTIIQRTHLGVEELKNIRTFLCPDGGYIKKGESKDEFVDKDNKR